MNGKEKKSKVEGLVEERSSNNKEKGFSNKKGKWNRGKKGGNERSYSRGKVFNDISFYTKNPNITEAFTKLPFSYIVGQPIRQIGSIPFTISGIVSFIVDWVAASYDTTSAGDEASDRSDILNQVATIIYTTMRRANAGATNEVEPTDVIISNLIASIDILCNSVSMRRVFGVANSFSWKNRLLPEEIFEHLGLDYDDFIANQAAYRGRFNTLVAKARTIKTLANFPFVNAAVAEYANVFKDSDNETGREQLMLPVKGFHHIYDPAGTTDHPGGTVRLMKYGDLPGLSYQDTILTTGYRIKSGVSLRRRKFSVDLDILSAQINALITDADFNLIQADIEKAFGEQSGYMVIDSVDDSTTITPVFSGEFMTMFHHGTFYPIPDPHLATAAGIVGLGYVPKGAYTNVICQTAGSSHLYGSKLIHALQLQFKQGTDVEAGEDLNLMEGYMALLNSNVDQPDTTEIINMTRYMAYMQDIGDLDASWDSEHTPLISNSYRLRLQVGSNFLCFGNMITYFKNYQVAGKSVIGKIQKKWDNMQYLDLPADLPQAMLQVSNRPFMWAFDAESACATCLNDLNNVRGISKDELRPIQDSCFLSLWDLPSRSTI